MQRSTATRRKAAEKGSQPASPDGKASPRPNPQVTNIYQMFDLRLEQLKMLAEHHQLPVVDDKTEMRRILQDSKLFPDPPRMTDHDTSAPLESSTSAAATPASTVAAPLASAAASVPAAGILSDQFDELVDSMAQLNKTVSAMLAQMVTIQAMQVSVTTLQTENTALNGTVASLNDQVQRLQASIDSAAEAPEADRKRCNLRLTRPPAECKSQTAADALAQKLWGNLGLSCSVPAAQLTKQTYADAANKDRKGHLGGSITLACASFHDKLLALKARRKLRDTEFHRMGLEEDLTKRQEANKNASWDAFVQARKAGKRTSWRQGQLPIDGHAYRPATATVQIPATTNQLRPPLPRLTPSHPLAQV